MLFSFNKSKKIVFDLKKLIIKLYKCKGNFFLKKIKLAVLFSILFELIFEQVFQFVYSVHFFAYILIFGFKFVFNIKSLFG